MNKLILKYKHRCMCGDSTMIDDVDKLMNGEKADMVFTDPPYNLAGSLRIVHAQKGKNQSKGSKLLQNSSWDQEFKIKDVLTNIGLVISKDINVLFVFSSQYIAAEIWEWMSTFCHWFGFCIYERTNPTPMAAITNKTMLISTDLCCYGHSKGHKINHPKGSYLSNVWRSSKVHQKDFVGHPTQKPIEMICRVLETIDFDICLDLFLGSGSTLIACEKTNRKCYGMELDEKYCDVIINRYQNFTGRTDCILESTGESYNSIAGKTDMPARCL